MQELAWIASLLGMLVVLAAFAFAHEGLRERTRVNRGPCDHLQGMSVDPPIPDEIAAELNRSESGQERP